ncbi:MAG TPA: S-adenosylmethionine decarboxylase proenzyme [Firmicutes bacterium]|nr:S-adenosylmethionine decarboxylase proenzyme [Bacillota bacterium]
MEKALGRHILCEAYGCDPEVLNDRRLVEELMVGAALDAGAEVREVAFHQFAPQGVSGVVVISESHLAIHTWPEYGYAAIDVFTCGERVNPRIACDLILRRLGAKEHQESELRRGTFPPLLETPLAAEEGEKELLYESQ